MSEQKKQNFLQGTALLAMATVIVKLVGALYKVPLNAIIGEKGFGYFSTAYEIYNILLMISTAGLPVAMSRMISEASSLEHYAQVRQVYATAKRIFLLLGIVGSVLMTAFCRPLARFWNQPDAWAAIGCLGPCAPCWCCWRRCLPQPSTTGRVRISPPMPPPIRRPLPASWPPPTIRRRIWRSLAWTRAIWRISENPFTSAGMPTPIAPGMPRRQLPFSKS